jgi:hypothetical protein
MSLILLIGCFIAFRQDARPIPPQAMWIFRVVLALSGAAFAGFLTGFLDITAKSNGWIVRSGGGLAVLILLYMLNPPDLLNRQAARPRKPVRFTIPPERINDRSKDDNPK